MTTEDTWLDSENDKSAFETLPAGRYQVLVDKVEVDETKAKREGTAAKGELVKVQFEVLNDQFAGRKLFERFNVSHDNTQAQNIGRGQLAQLCKAVGVIAKISPPKDANGHEIQDFTERKATFEAQLNAALYQKVCVVDVALTYDDFRKDNINQIKKYHLKETSLTGAPGDMKAKGDIF